MAAINGVKKSSVVKKKKSGKFGALAVVMTVLITLLLTLLAVVAFWKYYYQEKVTNQVIVQMEAGQQKAYKAIREIESGEYLDGAVEEVVIPSSIKSSELIPLGTDLSLLKASGNIAPNSLITVRNSYDPELQNPILEKTRIYWIDYLDTPGVEVGDFIDIRIKTYKEGDENSYQDSIVASKIEILSKNERGDIQIRLSESDLLNLNSAVIEAAGRRVGDDKIEGEIYVGKYVDPANQPKAAVTYNGKGISYTQEELREAQEILRGEKEEVADAPVNDQAADVASDVEGNGTVEDTKGGQN